MYTRPVSQKTRPEYTIGETVETKNENPTRIGKVVDMEWDHIKEDWWYTLEFEFTDDDGEKDTDTDIFRKEDLY